MKQLMSSYTLSPKKSLSRPIQFEISPCNDLYSILLSIESKECVIKDDLHGKKDIMYYDIAANFVLFNGFKARWRKGKLEASIHKVFMIHSRTASLRYGQHYCSNYSCRFIYSLLWHRRL
ncbi:hypothetical protein EDC96DRAFT_503400 [Choanephora cucurbitarum]|nr:hypothetical protein EDC96DRAFT_503400 [Choanephora cucurbitarum]